MGPYRLSPLVVPFLVLFIPAPPPLHADRIVLKSGHVYEGCLLRETRQEITLEVIVQGQVVEMSVLREHIRRHDKIESLLGRYRSRSAETDARDAGAQAALAEWCLDRNLLLFALRHARTAVRLDPDQKTAGRILKAHGFVRREGVWMTEDEAMRAKGLEPWKGEWRPKEEVHRLRAEEASARRRSRLDEIRRDRERISKERADLRTRIGKRKQALAGLEREVQACQKALETAMQRFADARRQLFKAEIREKEAEEAVLLSAGGILAWSRIVDPETRGKNEALQRVLDTAREVLTAKVEAKRASLRRDMARPVIDRLEGELDKLRKEAAGLSAKEEALRGDTPPP